MIDHRVVRFVRQVRVSQPLNNLLTTLLRGGLNAIGLRPGWLRHFPRSGLSVADLPNGSTLTLWSQGDDGVSSDIFWRGWSGYEPDSSRAFFELARGARTVVDVGAHVGFYSLLAARANPHGVIFAFEPLPSVAARLRLNIDLNDLGRRIDVHQIALGSKNDETSFFHVDGLPSSSSLSAEFMGRFCEVRETRVVQRRFDSLSQQLRIKDVDLVKIDVETAEAYVLDGMSETIAAWKPIVICEVLTTAGLDSIIDEYFRARGYAAFHLTNAGVVRAQRVVSHPRFLNYMFVPHSRRDALDRLRDAKLMVDLH